MSKSARTQTVDPSVFGPGESVQCATCGEREATHEIFITVKRGFDYARQKSLYSVTYSVCGECARGLVEVQLSARLRAS